MTDKSDSLDGITQYLDESGNLVGDISQRHLNEFVNEIMKFCVNSNYSKRVIVNGLDYCLYCISSETNLGAYWDKNNNQKDEANV